MKKQEHTLSNGKSVVVFDGLISSAKRDAYYTFIKNSTFRPNGYDSIAFENKGDVNLCSTYSVDDVNRMDFFSNPELAPVVELLRGFEFAQARVNMATLNDKNRIHTDIFGPSKTMIYYPNEKWEVEWGGYTMFTNDARDEIDLCVAYRPGRVVVFDGDTPHGSCAPTNLAPSYRFTFVVQFKQQAV